MGKKLKTKSVKFVFVDVFAFTNVLDLPFSSGHIFLESLKVFGFLVMLLYIIGKKVIFSVTNICSVVREANAAYMVWDIPNIYTAYSFGKFGPKI